MSCTSKAERTTIKRRKAFPSSQTQSKMSLKSSIFWIALIFLVGALTLSNSSVQAKVYGYCELARLLHNKHGIAKTELPNWLCLVQWESSFDTSRKHWNAYDGSTDWGLFQINDRYWCDPDNGRSSSNSCRVRCSKFLGTNQDEAVKCVRKIYKVHGFNAWVGWKNHCHGKKLANVQTCF